MSLINEFSRIPNFLKVTESGSMTLIGNLIVTNGISSSGGITGSYSISIPGLISGSSQVLSSLPAGTISGSSQLTSSFEIKGNGIVSGSSQVDVMSTTNINKLATTGSNTFFGTQTYSGSVYIANDLIVQGSSSIQYISASSVSIGTNIVQLNTANPSVRYAGLSIIDSGSIGGSGSFLYDSVQDEFIFIHRGDGVNVTSSHFVLGPETYNSLGDETYLSNNRLPKGTGKEHLNDSNITDSGTLITLASNTTITGTLSVTGTTLVSGSTQIKNLLPDGTLSSSAQIVSYNKFATTGSNTFTANQIISGTISATGIVFANSFNSIPISKGSSGENGSISIGSNSLSSVTTGYSNTAVGISALQVSTGGAINTAIGHSALSSNTDGNFNTAVGFGALSGNSSGNRNTAIGYNSGVGLLVPMVSGINNIFIGSRAEGESSSENNKTWIGNVDTETTWLGGELVVGTRYGSGGTHKVTISGSVQINGTQYITGSTYLTGPGGTGGMRVTLNNTSAGESQFALVNGGVMGTGIFGIRNGSTGTNLITIGSTGHMTPGVNGTQDLGSATYGWRNIYTNDLHLSNEGKPEGNDIDGTTGNWTIQEGAEYLYIINNKTGKKFKFSLEEIQQYGINSWW